MFGAVGHKARASDTELGRSDTKAGGVGHRPGTVGQTATLHYAGFLQGYLGVWGVRPIAKYLILQDFLYYYLFLM